MCDYDIGQNLKHCTFYIWLCIMLNVSCSNECHSKIKQKSYRFLPLATVQLRM